MREFFPPKAQKTNRFHPIRPVPFACKSVRTYNSNQYVRTEQYTNGLSVGTILLWHILAGRAYLNPNEYQLMNSVI